jgi:hypothetical protein
MAMLITRWEYRTYSVFMAEDGSWLSGLNQLGAEGWEVTDDITLFSQGGGTESPTLLLKRPRQ